MGNNVTLKCSDAHRTARQKSQPNHLAQPSYSSAEVEWDAFLEEQRRNQLETQTELAWRKTAEAHATLQRQEQELNAVRESERWLEEVNRKTLQTQARRTREREERRKAEEVRARQEREQELEVTRERERQRQEKVVAPPLFLSLPGVCRRHNSRQGCEDPNCRRLHICRLFLADICKHGVRCRYGHSLTTVHNQMICSVNNLQDTVGELALVQHLQFFLEENDQLPEAMYVNNLETCYNYCSRSSCHQLECNRFHICRQFIAGVCRRDGCMFGHDLHTTHNNGVLSRHRVTKMSDKEILNILRQKENGGQRVHGAASAVSYAKNGAIPRHCSSGAGNQPSAPSEPSQAPDGLSEELQCPICLEMFRRATILGCGHTFCADCLKEVGARSGDKCPLCRAHISSAIRSVTLDNIIRSIYAKQ